jgi:hypothetical protein
MFHLGLIQYIFEFFGYIYDIHRAYVLNVIPISLWPSCLATHAIGLFSVSIVEA